MNKRVVLNRIFPILICLLILILRLPSFNFPLDYDVGGHLFYGREVAKHGFYSTIQEIRPVGILTIFSLIYRIFGSSTVWINAVGAFCWLFSALIFFKLGKKLLGSSKIAMLATIFFVFLSSSRALQGEMTNIETFFLPFSLLGIYFFFTSRQGNKKIYFFFSGLAFGFAFMIKQLAIFDLLPVMFIRIFPLFSQRKVGFSHEIKDLVKDGLWFSGGFLAPMVFYLIYFSLKGQTGDFLYWQFANIQGKVSGYRYLGSALVNLKNSFIPILSKTNFIWFFAGGGILTTLFLKKAKERFFYFSWVASVFAGLYYLWWFFPHHFLQFVPAVSLFAAIFFLDITETLVPRFTRSSFSFPVILLGIFLTVSLGFFGSDWVYFYSYWEELQGKIDWETHLARVGFEVGQTGWVPFYKAADYVKKQTLPGEKIFVWGSLPLIYALSDREPASWFVYKFPLLPQELTPVTQKNWFTGMKENRERLLNELKTNIPVYFLVEVQPDQVFDEMNSFPQLGRFISENYLFEKQFGNILVYRKNASAEVSLNGGDDSDKAIIPWEIVDRYAVVKQIEDQGKQKRVIFEPMVNNQGILRELKTNYPSFLKVEILPLLPQYIGFGKEDLVGFGSAQPSGVPDLQIRLKGLPKPVSFVRVKLGSQTWNNCSYGVNVIIKVVQKGELFNLYLEPVPFSTGQVFEIYFIYEDGDLASSLIKVEERK